MQKLSVYIILIVIFLLEVWRISIDSELTTKGNELALVQLHLEQLRTENAELADQLLTAKAYTTIEQKAQKPDFGPAQYMYLKIGR